MAVGEREVGGVVGHGVTLRLDAHAGVGDGEVARGVLGHGYRLHGVALVLVHGLQCVVEVHVGVERVVLRTDLLLCDGVVERCADLGLLGEELA